MARPRQERPPRRAGAPPWRRAFQLLGCETSAPSADARNAAAIPAAVPRRSLGQLLSLVQNLEASLHAFGPILARAPRARRGAAPPSGRQAEALREVTRFLFVAQETVRAVTRRRLHPLDDPRAHQELYLAACALSAALDRRAATAGIAIPTSHPRALFAAEPRAARRSLVRPVALGVVALLVLLAIGFLWGFFTRG